MTAAADSAWSGPLLDRMQYEADPLADGVVAALLGDWQHVDPGASKEEVLLANATRWQKLAQVTRWFDQWTDNAAVGAWRAPPGTPPEAAAAIENYLRQAAVLPEWANRQCLRRAEELFMDHGVLSCLLLFCASLPECYVVPDLSQALHVTGQLEQHTEHRIRSTAAMIFPVMSEGGLTQPHGAGVAQVLKVRLIHATVRHLILRGTPEAAVAALHGRWRTAGSLVVPPLPALARARQMHQALLAHGWEVGRDGLPCNQEELAYTLLTFHYVFLRGLRTLGIGLPPADERAYLHAWNVVGHLVGIRRDLMADTMEQAQALFEAVQRRSRADPYTPDPRPALAGALMQAMERVIPLPLFKPLPRLLTRLLCGGRTVGDIGIARGVGWPSRLLFALLVVITRSIDGVVRWFVPHFSIARFFTRLVGRRLTAQLLMDQTRPLRMPPPVVAQTRQMMQRWQDDPRAPRWMNRLEQRLTRGLGPPETG